MVQVQKLIMCKPNKRQSLQKKSVVKRSDTSDYDRYLYNTYTDEQEVIQGIYSGSENKQWFTDDYDSRPCFNLI